MWLRQNQNRFKGKIYEPMILEVRSIQCFEKRSIHEHLLSQSSELAIPITFSDVFVFFFSSM